MHVSPYQRVLSTQIATRLERLGYQLARKYRFSDMTTSPTAAREVPLVAFSHAPLSQESACLGVIFANGQSGLPHVNEYRSLGALLYFELHANEAQVWKVGADAQETTRVASLPGSDVLAFVDQRSEFLRAETVRQAKVFPGRRRQLDLFDFGLPLMLETIVSAKLDELLTSAVSAGFAALPRLAVEQDLKRISETTFACLAAKILNDRGVGKFALDADAPEEALRQVHEHYREDRPWARLPRAAIVAVAQEVWSKVDLSNVSPSVLSYVYERTLVTEKQRQKLGTHGTPLSLARYIVSQIPWESYAPDERVVFEPCCGHSVFLLAAMGSLSALWPGTDAKKRHQYLRERLFGIDTDQFAVEIGKLSLMLADWPNPNGWHLAVADVFKGDALAQSVARADVVLCNPPFGDFEARPAGSSSVHKPVALLDALVRNAKPNATFGLVLPRAFLDGRSYRGVRRALAERFRRVQVMSLPDTVFQSSDAETAVFIGLEARAVGGSRSCTVVWSAVDRDSTDAFLSTHSLRDTETRERTIDEAGDSLRLQRVALWGQFEASLRVGDIASVHRGIEWLPGTPSSVRFTAKPTFGYARGLERASGGVLNSAFVPPKTTSYLCVRDQVLRRDPWRYPWPMPKVIMNAARTSRGRWCVRAFADYQGLVTSQRFHVLWPVAPWTPRALVAVLNGPIANAYLAEHSDKRDLQKRLVSQVPIPNLSVAEIDALDERVRKLEECIESKSYQLGKALLIAIDAVVLIGYGIRERSLFGFSASDDRPVPWSMPNVFDVEAADSVSFPKWSQGGAENELPPPGTDYLQSAEYKAMVAAMDDSYVDMEQEAAALAERLRIRR